MQNLSLGSLKFLFFLSFQSFQLVEFFFRVYNTYFNGIFCISWQNTAVASTLKPQHHPQKKMILCRMEICFLFALGCFLCWKCVTQHSGQMFYIFAVFSLARVDFFRPWIYLGRWKWSSTWKFSLFRFIHWITLPYFPSLSNFRQVTPCLWMFLSVRIQLEPKHS